LKPSRALRLQLILLALCLVIAWLLPRFESVRAMYSASVYPSLQSNLTRLSNRVSVPLFDITVGIAIIILLITWIASVRRARQRRSVGPAARGLVSTALVLALIYVWFLLAWGLNYSRPPLERSVPFDAKRITPGALQALAARAVSEANRTYEAAHAAGFPSIDASPPQLAEAVRQVTKEFGHAAPAVLAQPKHSMFSPYFRASGVSGMLAPFFLETLVNPDLTGPERPYVLAHEWAHLSGFAPEADAGFIGILASLRADVPANYSAWLALVSEAASQLPPATRNLVLRDLAPGPRADQEAINARLRALVPQVERVAWAAYDRALKSQGVVEGIESYSRVVQLLLGTDALKIPS
jgi:hypothetical protein